MEKKDRDRVKAQGRAAQREDIWGAPARDSQKTQRGRSDKRQMYRQRLADTGDVVRSPSQQRQRALEGVQSLLPDQNMHSRLSPHPLGQKSGMAKPSPEPLVPQSQNEEGTGWADPLSYQTREPGTVHPHCQHTSQLMSPTCAIYHITHPACPERTPEPPLGPSCLPHSCALPAW